ncbi:MAG: CotS family spore coat protein [Lutisporaceae bacterium]
MSGINQEPINEVLSNYDIKVEGIRNESYKDKKGVWWVQTPQGYKILKKISNSEDTFKYILSAVKHLTNNGIRIPKINSTRDGRDYVNISGTCYVLSDAVNGRNPRYESPRELEAVIKEMARFHRASAGFSSLPGTKPKVHLGKWIEDYQEQIDDMEKFYKYEKAQEQTGAIGKLIIHEFPGFYSRAINAINGLKGSEYKEWVDKVSKTGGLCHQDFAAGNLLMDTSNTMYVLDTDSITIDIPARDIRKIFNKVMKKVGSWNIDLTEKIMDYYQSENPLSLSEWHVVKLDLMFPHLFIGAMNKYYYKRDKEWSYGKYLLRLREMSAFEKSIIQVLDNFESLLPGKLSRKE